MFSNREDIKYFHYVNNKAMHKNPQSESHEINYIPWLSLLYTMLEKCA